MVKFFSKPTRETKNAICIGVASVLVFTAWWLMIDLNMIYPDLIYMLPIYNIPIILATSSFLILNMVRIFKKQCGSIPSKIFLLFGVIMALTSIASAFYIMINDHVLVDRKCSWPGLVALMGTLFIFIANLLLKFGIKKDLVKNTQ